MCRKLPKNSGSSQSHAGAVRRRVCQLVAIRLARSNTIGSVTMKDYIATSILRNLRIFCVLTILLGAPAAFAEEADSGLPLIDHLWLIICAALVFLMQAGADRKFKLRFPWVR